VSKNVATNKHDPLAKLRDPPDGEKRIDDALQFQSGTIDAEAALSPERERELREQLTDDSALLPRICGAHTRRGTACMCKKLYKNGRCKFHGGLSTGPKTPKGKARAALNLPNAKKENA
jgi:hypothetical protein